MHSYGFLLAIDLLVMEEQFLFWETKMQSMKPINFKICKCVFVLLENEREIFVCISRWWPWLYKRLNLKEQQLSAVFTAFFLCILNFLLHSTQRIDLSSFNSLLRRIALICLIVFLHMRCSIQNNSQMNCGNEK